jgi:uncharacterized protein YndB with AHSA1/START domain
MTAGVEVTIHEKKEDFMGGKYERTFVVAVPIARAWRAFVDPKERENYVAAPGQRGDMWEEGELQSIVPNQPPREIEIGKVEPMRVINYREGMRLGWTRGDPSVTDWLDVTVTFEEEASGTRITFTRSGFGDSEEWGLLRQATSLGQDETLADLVFYLETGIPVHGLRHFNQQKGSVGASMLESYRGIEIVEVIPGGFAEQAGLRAGDTLVQLGGAAVYKRSDVHAVERALGPGARVVVMFARAGQILTGDGTLSEAGYTQSHGARGA